MTVYQDAPHEPLDELGLLLARYADSVLKPDPFAMDRVRAELRARAQRAAVRRRAEALALAAVPAAVVTVPSRRIFGGWSMRRASFAMAASLVLGLTIGGTTFAASRAGGGLYAARLWIETATLSRDPEARLEGEIAFAGTRLAEAAEATVKGDAPAATAALDAFGAIVQLAIDENPSDSPGHERALVAFHHHQDVLTSLLTRVPEAAQSALSHALLESDKAIAQLESAPGKPADPGQPGDPGNQGGGGGGPAATDHPAKTPKPPRTPDPADPVTPTPSHGNGGGGGNGGNGGGGSGDAGGQPASHSPPPGGGSAGSGPPGQQRTPKP